MLDLMGSSLGKLLPVVKNSNGIADVHYQFHIMFYQYHRNSQIPDLANRIHQMIGFLGVHTSSRLVKEQ